MKSAVIVSGDTSGLGKVIAQHYIDNGVAVVGISRRESPSSRTHYHISASVTDVTALREAFNYVKVNNLSLEAVINSAGVGHFGKVGDYTDREIEEVIASNFVGPILLANLALEHWTSAPPHRTVHIENVLSTAAFTARPAEAVYSAAKAGLEMFGDALRIQTKGTEVSVINFMPGGMNTPFWSDQEQAARFMDPQDVARILIAAIESPGTAQVTDIVVNRRA